MSSSGTSTSRIQSPSVAAIWSSSVPISTGRPIRFFLASQVVMIPSCGERMFIDSICSSMISIRSLALLAVIFASASWAWIWMQLLLVLACDRGFCDLHARARCIWLLGLLPRRPSGPCSSFLQLVALELDEDVSLLDPVVVVDQHLGDDAGAPARRSCAVPRASSEPWPSIVSVQGTNAMTATNDQHGRQHRRRSWPASGRGTSARASPSP